MRAIIAAVLMLCLGTGCCKTCGWCHDDAPSRANSGVPLESPPVSSAQPPAPAGVPVGRPAGTGAYGGTGN